MGAGILALLCGCRQPAEPLEDERYVEVMVALRMLNRETQDPVEFEAGKDSILRAADVTDSMLVAFARRHGDDVAHMAALWDTIARRLLDADTILR